MLQQGRDGVLEQGCEGSVWRVLLASEELRCDQGSDEDRGSSQGMVHGALQSGYRMRSRGARQPLPVRVEGGAGRNVREVCSRAVRYPSTRVRRAPERRLVLAGQLSPLVHLASALLWTPVMGRALGKLYHYLQCRACRPAFVTAGREFHRRGRVAASQRGQRGRRAGRTVPLPHARLGGVGFGTRRSCAKVSSSPWQPSGYTLRGAELSGPGGESEGFSRPAPGQSAGGVGHQCGGG